MASQFEPFVHTTNASLLLRNSRAHQAKIRLLTVEDPLIDSRDQRSRARSQRAAQLAAPLARTLAGRLLAAAAISAVRFHADEVSRTIAESTSTSTEWMCLTPYLPSSITSWDVLLTTSNNNVITGLPLSTFAYQNEPNECPQNDW